MPTLHLCIDCSNPINFRSKRCRPCNNKNNNGMTGKIGILSPLYLHGGKFKCKDCSKPINFGYKRCHSCAAKDFQSTKEFKEKLIKRNIGSGNPMFGKKQTKETRIKISLKAGGSGNLDDLNRYKYGSGFTETLKELVRSRDNYTCQNPDCSLTNEEHLIIYNCSLAVHHIDYNKNNNVIENLISLCFQCHARTNYNRNYWKEFFNVTSIPYN